MKPQALVHTETLTQSSHLDDGGVQGVEIQQDDNLVIQALLGLQHKTSCILRALLLGSSSSGFLALGLACVVW